VSNWDYGETFVDTALQWIEIVTDRLGYGDVSPEELDKADKLIEACKELIEIVTERKRLTKKFSHNILDI
jgi:hypothetical protein